MALSSSRSHFRLLALSFVATVTLAPRAALADYAPPPDDRYPPPDRYDRYEPPEPYPRDEGEPRSTVRLFTGPLLRFSDEMARGGLGLSLDAGARAAGVRFSGAWVRSGSVGGLSQYGAEIWVDFAEHEPFHPILAAGAALARLDRASEADRVTADTLGAGTLRATLQYRLPVRGVDARAALDVVGVVPAVGVHASEHSPWATALLGVGVGF
ncbi:MAG TPA: hypothetical protein VHE30_19940 [Polyangiaceae bacterium]|nr:hypothetical protein [Polyangiaceae bacterium]